MPGALCRERSKSNPGKGTGIGDRWILFCLDDHPSRIIHLGKGIKQGLEVEIAVAGYGEHPFENSIQEAAAAIEDRFKHGSTDILAMDVGNALRYPLDDRNRGDLAQCRMARIERQTNILPCAAKEAVKFVFRLDGRPQMMMISKPQALVLDEVGERGQPIAENLPFLVTQVRRLGNRTASIAVNRPTSATKTGRFSASA